MNTLPTPVQLQLESILAQYSNISAVHSALEIAIRQEQAIIKRILDEMAWQQLDDASKQEKRKSKLSLMDKWSYEEGNGIDVSYEISVVALYDCIEEMLRVLSEDTPITIRLKGALLVEKLFINEQQEFSKMRHFDLDVWNAILGQIGETDTNLDVATLDSLFKQMYFKWPKRPYKSVL
jgi:hypothetical protein